MTTIYEVAKLAGVSLATVSRVMNGQAKVKDNTRHKVEQAMLELGYVPNNFARSLASSKANSVGLLVSNLDSAFFGEMMSGVETELRAAGKQVIISAGHDEESTEKAGIDFLISRQCDALIIHSEAVSDEYILQLNNKKLPILLINRIVEGMEDQCFIVNNEVGGYLAAKTLLDKGHKEIAYISGPEFKKDARQRLQGHKRALQEYAVPFDEELFYRGDYLENSGRDGMSYLLSTGRHFSALACSNDEMASGAMSYAREEGLILPDDLSVIGFDDVLFAKHMFPKLTTIDNPVLEMGQMAAKWIIKNIYKESCADIQHVFEPQLIERLSVIENSAGS
ncbi:LacI family DNA-binding transcriptional regulator [Aliiglaciecola sp. LCG003]|uniref:LacI family DNA-binding transcriptional regulator n=1 Tax=Aliiglaciecola sp. LCG003 TaxID=3053655 RepID=UPI002574835F|nr:LacI family DNA-binding transcriptional regulator [Aliiglaciecola sp. LCG003]WJG09544.1 LacI family DNA-binding transcriptional regulator [Aliiglaciecola sp. LCG003]